MWKGSIIIMNLRDFDTSQPTSATVLSNERITPPESDADVRHLVLEAPDSLLGYREGQSIGVIAPVTHDFGNYQHVRLYSIASPRKGEGGEDRISICVRRCFYIDDVSGERYPGIASNFLCDTVPGDAIQITGPYGSAFTVPEDGRSNLLMVGVGTGIAPFRAFLRHTYEDRGGWQGKVRLFYGARTGMELLYMNEFKKDLGLYYDDQSFKAFAAVNLKPYSKAGSELGRVIADNVEEIWALIQDPKTYVYVAGLVEASKKFEKAMADHAGSEQAWLEQRAILTANGRYSELLYE
jgi:ferredoxin--NADP+ reductase